MANEASVTPQAPVDRKILSEIPWDLGKIGVFILVMVVLFLYTRACPFSSGTYWDLFLARDFDLNVGLSILPETIAFNVAQSSLSIIGLKALYHFVFFVLCLAIMVWVFKGNEMIPGVIVLCVFAFTVQPLISLRWMLQLIFMLGVMIAFEGDTMKGSFGVLLIPFTAAASLLGLNAWMLLILIACHALFTPKCRLSLILCGLIGVLFFPEGPAAALNSDISIFSQFVHPEDTKLLNLLAGIFLMPTLLNLPRLVEEKFANLVFFAITGFFALLNPGNIFSFIALGAVLLLDSLSEIEPFSPNGQLLGTIVIVAIIHLFLFLNPSGFSLNPSVRGELGQTLEPLIKGEIIGRRIQPHEIGELAWKGLVKVETPDLEKFRRLPYLEVMADAEGFRLQIPEEFRMKEEAASATPVLAEEPGNDG